MNFLQNIDLFSVGLAVAAIGILGFVVYLSNRNSITNRTFLIFSVVTFLWGIVNYSHYQTSNPELALWLLRISLLFAVWVAFYIFQLFYVFPEEKVFFPELYTKTLVAVVIITSLLTLTPFVFQKVTEISPDGQILRIDNGPGIFLFGIVAVGLVVSGLALLLRKTIKAKGDERRQFGLVLTGALIMFALIITFNFIFPAFLNNADYIPLGAVFILPFVAFATYAILHHHLLGIKVIATEIMTFFLSIVVFYEVIFAPDITIRIFRIGIFLLVLAFGILLIKSVRREVEQREEIQKLAERLKSVNSILAHDVKGAVIKDRNAFSVLLDGTYGPIPEQARPLLGNLLKDAKKMLDTITNILASGRDMVLAVEPFNLKDVVLEVVKDLQEDYEKKHITVNTDMPGGDYTITADKAQLTAHVLKNLIENAINYNLENGSIRISLSKKDPETFLFAVKDTGVGIKDEDKPNMFKEGGRGKESSKINIHSSGYGLVTAKKTVEAHGGKIWFESEGISGKGATFFVELPVTAKIRENKKDAS